MSLRVSIYRNVAILRLLRLLRSLAMTMLVLASSFVFLIMPAMQLTDVIQSLLRSPNVASRKPIFEKYDKNVQGNTVHERGNVAASICVPFRDFEELSDSNSKIGVAIANGGNPNLAKISAEKAAEHAIVQATVQVSCVSGVPLGATDCLNFGNPEKKDHMGDFVAGVEGLKTACETLDIPIVSGNVSLYNESSEQSIPPSAMVSVFARVDDPSVVPQLKFEVGDAIFYVGQRSDHLGGSELLNVLQQKDSRLPELDYVKLKSWLELLRQAAGKNIIRTAAPMLRGGLILTVIQSCFLGDCGADLYFEKVNPGLLFSENPGVIIAGDPSIIEAHFGDQATRIGRVIESEVLNVMEDEKEILDLKLPELKTMWENVLRDIV